MCTFVCEVHGAAEKLECRRVLGSLGKEPPRGDAQKDPGTPPETSPTDDQTSQGAVGVKVLKTNYTYMTIHVFGRTLSRTPSAASNAFPTGVRRTALWSASTITGGTRLFSSARSSGFCATWATTRAAKEFSTKE